MVTIFFCSENQCLDLDSSISELSTLKKSCIHWIPIDFVSELLGM